MIYTAKDIAAILAAEALITDATARVEYLVTDSRRISFPATSLFFALQTARRDAHQFIEEVHERGVNNFVVRKGFDTSAFTNANFIFVEERIRRVYLLLRQK